MRGCFGRMRFVNNSKKFLENLFRPTDQVLMGRFEHFKTAVFYGAAPCNLAEVH